MSYKELELEVKAEADTELEEVTKRIDAAEQSALGQAEKEKQEGNVRFGQWSQVCRQCLS